MTSFLRFPKACAPSCMACQGSILLTSSAERQHLFLYSSTNGGHKLWCIWCMSSSHNENWYRLSLRNTCKELTSWNGTWVTSKSPITFDLTRSEPRIQFPILAPRLHPCRPMQQDKSCRKHLHPFLPSTQQLQEAKEHGESAVYFPAANSAIIGASVHVSFFSGTFLFGHYPIDHRKQRMK